MSCLSVELYLKSKLYLVSHEDGLERSHDVVNLYKALLTRYQPKTGFDRMIARCRKYFNESRYPYTSDVSIYTKEFAEEFIKFASDIRNFIDNDCLATMDDLKDG
jgi:HEPN domain-containing protein